MQDAENILDRDLTDLSPQAWKAGLTEMVEEYGMVQPLGSRHFASFVDQGNTLIVTFETTGGIQSLSNLAQPLGFELVRRHGWSHLGLVSNGETWFRDEEVYGFFDQLIDDGFFDEFDRVLFFGGGPCAYAAAAFSVAAPGATVIAIQPQATLDPSIAGWDDRFTEMRRTSFTDRYGYAPDMIEAAEKAYLIYDPKERLDAMHAALFRASNVEHLTLPNMGQAVQSRMIEMGLLFDLIAKIGNEEFTRATFFQMTRARRDHRGYLRGLLQQLDQADRPRLAYMLCANANERIRAPRFRQRLEQLEKEFPEFKRAP